MDPAGIHSVGCECERLWDGVVGIFHFGCVEDVSGMHAFKLEGALPSWEQPYLRRDIPVHIESEAWCSW